MKHLILGGTGTLGRAVVKQLLQDLPSHQIAIFSRGELEQQKMRSEFPELEYVIGDIRDFDAVTHAMRGVDFAYHFAALKHVDVVEANPLEAVKTNVDGTRNVAQAAMRNNVGHLIFSSTDKAVLPINIYGMTKAIAEKYLVSLPTRPTTPVVYRWGNVIGSRGSAIPIFVRQLLNEEPVTLTHPEMTRFWIRIESAAKFILDTMAVPGIPGPRIPEMGAAKVKRIILVLAEMLGVKLELKFTGIRPGEKIHECLLSSHDGCLNSHTARQYTDEELHDLLEPTVKDIINAQ